MSDVKDVNPFKNYIEGQRNCVMCTNALEMRKRGYDVTAGLSASGSKSSMLSRMWDGAVTYKENSNTIENRIKSFGKQGSGEIIGRYDADGLSISGHSLYFNVDDSTNAVSIYDGQNGQYVGGVKDMITKYGFSPDFFQVTRLDNATPNLDNMISDQLLLEDKDSFKKYGIWDFNRGI